MLMFNWQKWVQQGGQEGWHAGGRWGESAEDKGVTGQFRVGEDGEVLVGSGRKTHLICSCLV